LEDGHILIDEDARTGVARQGDSVRLAFRIHFGRTLFAARQFDGKVFLSRVVQSEMLCGWLFGVDLVSLVDLVKQVRGFTYPSLPPSRRMASGLRA